MNTPELIAFIIGIVLSVGISALAIYAILTIKKLSKYDKDIPKQIEFCKSNRTCFIALMIVSAVFLVGVIVCYSFLVTRRDDYIPIFLLPFIFISLIPTITFFTACFASKYRKHAEKDKEIKTRMNIWFMIAFSMIGIGITFMIIGMPLLFCVSGIVGEIGRYIAIVGAIALICSLCFTLIACFKARKTTKSPTMSNVKEHNINVGKEIIVNEEAKRQFQKEAELMKQELEEKERQEQSPREEKARQMREMHERITRERAEEDEKERIRQEKRKQSIANLNANKEKLILEYSNTIENFIEKLNEYSAVFLYLFNDTEIPRSSILVNPYRNQHYLFCDTVKRDGLCFSESSNAEANKTIQNLTDFLIQGLKKRIKENNEWEDEYTLPVLLYYIVRNNVVRHYHNLYLKEIGCLTLEDFCVKFANVEIPQDWAFGYTYYYIYENDINLPFMETYKKLCAEMLKTITEQKQRKLESDLFGTHKPKSTHTDNSFAKTLSPIEQIDLMSGQEFEIYMEAFFAQKGYKVERTPLSGDYGVDLIIEHTFGRTGVQLKCYSKKVPADAVQQIVTGLRHYKLSNGMVITNNYFQKEAITLAAENHIELWDRDKLIKELN